MKISEAAKRCGLSEHTIRFYDSSGMLPEIARGSDGHRRFTPRHVEWLTLLFWLRETGMPLKQMRRFASLAKAGDAGVAQRREILADHAEALKAKRAVLDKCERVLAIKIASYGSADDDAGA
ncbi:MAG: MerR family transcriptional regulator [Pseudomonadota bacterium]